MLVRDPESPRGRRIRSAWHWMSRGLRRSRSGGSETAATSRAVRRLRFAAYHPFLFPTRRLCSRSISTAAGSTFRWFCCAFFHRPAPVRKPVENVESPRLRSVGVPGRKILRSAALSSACNAVLRRERCTLIDRSNSAPCLPSVSAGNQCRTEMPQPAGHGGIESGQLTDPLEPVVHGVGVYVQ